MHTATLVKAVKERQRNQLLLEQYKYLVDQSAILCKLTPQGRITYVNDRFCEISGYGQRELIGLPIDIIRHPSESPELGRTLFATLADGEAKIGNAWVGKGDVAKAMEHFRAALEATPPAQRREMLNGIPQGLWPQLQQQP